MKILLALHHYFVMGGSEIFAYTIAKTLVRKGHRVYIYSPYIAGELVDKSRSLGVTVTDKLESLQNERFDIANVSQNIIAYEVRYYFARLPIVYLSHCRVQVLDYPPRDELNISRFLAVSETVRDNLILCDVPKKDIEIFYNIVDTNKFQSTKPINPTLKKALIFSKKYSEFMINCIKEACANLDVDVEEAGKAGHFVTNVDEIINRVDVVFASARGILEAMSCGRAAVILGDGMVETDKIDELQKYNFSGKRFKHHLTVNWVQSELCKYTPSMSKINRAIVEERYSAEKKVDELLEIYKKAIFSFECLPIDKNKLFLFVESIQQTRNYTTHTDWIKRNIMLRSLEKVLNLLYRARRHFIRFFVARS